jgi:hypothetical protein
LFEETDNDLEAETALSKGVCLIRFFCQSTLALTIFNRSIFVNELVGSIPMAILFETDL